jgi:hypothetical protein
MDHVMSDSLIISQAIILIDHFGFTLEDILEEMADELTERDITIIKSELEALQIHRGEA